MSRFRKPADMPFSARSYWAAEHHPDVRSDLVYLAWGLRNYRRSPTVPPPQNAWSYIVVLQGSPTIVFKNQPHRLSPNQAVLASVHHGFEWQGEADAYADLLVWMWRTCPTVAELTPPTGGCHVHCLHKESLGRLQALHAVCRQEVARPDSLTRRSLRALRGLLDVEFARAFGTVSPKTDDQARVEQAVRRMREHLDLANPIFMLRDYLQISSARLKRLFADAFAESPARYYLRLRMQRAQELLQDGTLSVKEIAFKLGYKHPNDFSRAYKTFHGTHARRF
ncbi:MAG: helix-turn-helix transcriptional regulator [Verrucomicrobia bacterium]|nr:helix-turn-helix transcriptional regulator [Verrucomicrobiota bacterium]